jgi:DNA-directed RNA polymerase specialized sigma24 family protein
MKNTSPARSFRAWLKTVTHHAWQDFVASRRTAPLASGGDAAEERLASVAALAAMGNHDVREATRQLQAAPVALRGWEWRHLQGRLDQSLAVVSGLPKPELIAFAPPGRRRVASAIVPAAAAALEADARCK